MTDMTQNIIIAKIIIKIKMAVKGYQGGSEVFGEEFSFLLT